MWVIFYQVPYPREGSGILWQKSELCYMRVFISSCLLTLLSGYPLFFRRIAKSRAFFKTRTGKKLLFEAVMLSHL